MTSAMELDRTQRLTLMSSADLLKPYEGAAPLPTEINADGKSLVNTPGQKSESYDSFPEPFVKNKNGFDFHSE